MSEIIDKAYKKPIPKIIRQVVKTIKKGEEAMHPLVDSIKLVGEIRLVLKDRHGNLKEDRLIKNTITSVGKAAVAGLMLADVGGTAFD